MQIQCIRCGKSVYRKPRDMATAKYCSSACKDASRTSTPVSERFWPKILCDIATRCWIWTGAVNITGYGKIGKGGRSRGLLATHRVSWELAHGPIPDGLHVLHHCDNPPCCNPEHLFLGTRSDNMKDMEAKGRGGDRRNFGPQNGRWIDGRAIIRKR